MSPSPDTTPKTTETVIAVIAEIKRIPAERVSVESSFEELGIDSLDGVEIVAELEEVFDVSIPNEVAFEMRSVRQVVEGLEELMRGRASGPAAG